ncbi:unnamed protein product [Strongylus vulgaris]|uniref:Uncharacterized protein n=1 Tax=Strongylus vulgaris TaxID=40348 RepID=A0A3P7I0G4_STRVU|nr:unnamed protein product [Strongylus vulgaris]
MGLCQSAEDKQLAQKSKAIDKEMMQGHLASQKVVKLLLLVGYCADGAVTHQAAGLEKADWCMMCNRGMQKSAQLDRIALRYESDQNEEWIDRGSSTALSP